MPLIIVCGLPCSGKTKRTEEICEILAPEKEKRDWTAINVVNDDLAGVKYSGKRFLFFKYIKKKLINYFNLYFNLIY